MSVSKAKVTFRKAVQVPRAAEHRNHPSIRRDYRHPRVWQKVKFTFTRFHGDCQPQDTTLGFCLYLHVSTTQRIMAEEPVAKRKCIGLDCNNDASSLQCPNCLKLDIKDSFFCSQDCFKRSWVRTLSLLPTTTHCAAFRQRLIGIQN